MSEVAELVETPPEAEHLQDIFSQNIGETLEPEESDNEEDNGAEDVKIEEETVVEEEPAVEETQDEIIARLQEETARLSRKYDDAQSFISKQGNDIGNLRKELREGNAKSNEDVLNDFVEDPRKAMRDEMETIRLEEEETRRSEQVFEQTSMNDVLRHVPNFKELIPDIKGFYKEKGASADFINQLTPESLSRNVDQAVALAEAVQLKAKLKAVSKKNETVINKINKGATTVKSNSGVATSDTSISVPRDLTNLSDAELAKLLSQRRST